MKKIKPWVNPEEDVVKESFYNAYRLLIGEVTYGDLGSHFLLPENHEDPQVTLAYYIQVEDYEKCIKIRNKIKENEFE